MRSRSRSSVNPTVREKGEDQRKPTTVYEDREQHTKHMSIFPQPFRSTQVVLASIALASRSFVASASGGNPTVFGPAVGGLASEAPAVWRGGVASGTPTVFGPAVGGLTAS